MENSPMAPSVASPVTGFQKSPLPPASGTPVVASPSMGREVVLPPTPADPSFTLTPTPSRPNPAIFQGFSPAPSTRNFAGQTPASSPVAFGVPLAAATPKTVVVTAAAEVATPGTTEGVDPEGELTPPPPEGHVYGCTPATEVVVPKAKATPASVAFAGFGTSPAPPHRPIGPADLGLTPPPTGYVYGEQATPEPLSRLSSGNLPAEQPKPNPGLHTPTWNTPTHGRNTGLTPIPPLQQSNQQKQQVAGEQGLAKNCVVNTLFGEEGRTSPLSMSVKKLGGGTPVPADQTENHAPVEV